MKKQAFILGIASLLAGLPATAQQPTGTVTLPLAEYDRLQDRAAHPAAKPEAPPIASTVASASIRAQVGNGIVRGTIELAGEVFQTGAVKVPLVTSAALTSAERAGKPLALLAEGATHAAILQGPEAFALRLAFALPVMQEPGRASCQLPATFARSTRLRLEIPRGHAEVLLEGGLARRTAQDGTTVLEATLEPGRAARISWTVRDVSTAAAPREARFVSDVATLASVGEIDLRLAVMLDVSVVIGDPASFTLKLPEGFELVSSSGVSLDSAKTKDGALTLLVSDPTRRRHQFLLALERTAQGGLLEAEVPIVSLLGAQRETGEVAVEGVGTMELSAKEEGTLRRMDTREVGPTLRALARQPLLAAFRYHRRPSEAPRLTIQAQRFPDALVLAALAEQAVVTTLVTAEGRSLSEVSLTVRNQAQPYLRVALPQGATLVSAAIAGEAVKPVEGVDGARVPLLRPGFRPTGPYTVSFVYMGAGSAFGKKGEARLTLARMDLPIGALYWEMFVPDKYKVKDFGGEAWRNTGFKTVDVKLEVGAITETVEVQAQGFTAPWARDSQGKTSASEGPQGPSESVVDLQRRVAGVLPVRIDVPRSGTSLRFVRPLVLDEETTVTFKYKTR